MLQIMLGNINSLCTATCHWIELYISHFLYIRPFTVVKPNNIPMSYPNSYRILFFFSRLFVIIIYTWLWSLKQATHFFFLKGLESMYSLAKKCMQLKPMTSSHILIGLVIGIIGDNTEVSNVNQILVVYILCHLICVFSFPRS